LPSNLRPTTRKCVHLVTRGHFRSRDKGFRKLYHLTYIHTYIHTERQTLPKLYTTPLRVWSIKHESRRINRPQFSCKKSLHECVLLITHVRRLRGCLEFKHPRRKIIWVLGIHRNYPRLRYGSSLWCYLLYMILQRTWLGN